MKKAIIRAKQQNKQQNIDWKTEIIYRNIKKKKKIKEQEQKIIEQGLRIKELEALAAGYYCDNYGGDEALESLERAEKALEEYKQKYGLEYGLKSRFN